MLFTNKKVRNVSVIGLYHKTREITVHKRQSLKSNMTSIKGMFLIVENPTPVTRLMRL